MAGDAQRARRHRGRQRHRKVVAAQGVRRNRGPRFRFHLGAARRQHRLPAAGGPFAFRPHRLRRMHDGVQRRARARRRAGATDAPHGRARPLQRRVRPGGRALPSRRKRIPRARRLRHRSAGRRGAFRPRVFAARLEAPHGGILRRLADAHRAGQAAARKTQPAAARRAHQPPRPGSAQLAGRVPGRLSARLRAGLARPLFSGRDGAQNRRAVEQGSAFLHRRLLALRRAEDRAPRPTPGRLQQPAGPHPAARSVHQPLPLPGHQGEAGAKPHQGTGADGADRDSAGREVHPLPLSAAQAERPGGGRIPEGGEELWRPSRCSRASIS